MYSQMCAYKKNRLKVRASIFRILKFFEAVTFGFGTSWPRIDNCKNSLPGVKLRKNVSYLFSSS